MGRIFLLCNDAPSIIRIIRGDNFQEVYDDTVARNDGELLIEVEEDVLSNLVADAAMAYWENVKVNILKEFSGGIPEDVKNRMCRWIQWWGNGGGMLSIEETFEENILTASNTYEELFKNIENDFYFETATALLFGEVLQTMISECVDDNNALWGDK